MNTCNKVDAFLKKKGHRELSYTERIETATSQLSKYQY